MLFGIFNGNMNIRRLKLSSDMCVRNAISHYIISFYTLPYSDSIPLRLFQCYLMFFNTILHKCRLHHTTQHNTTVLFT